MKWTHSIPRLLLLLAATTLLTTESAPVEITGVDHGEITSPNFPAGYGNELELSWRITVEEGYQIQYFFTEFQLEDSYDEDQGGACAYDYVQLSANGDAKKYCGVAGCGNGYCGSTPRVGRNYLSGSNVIDITFRSDFSNEDDKGLPLQLAGFRMYWVKVDIDECAEMARKRRTQFEDWDELIDCNHFCINTPGSYQCSCRPGFHLHENGHTCTETCQGVVLTEDAGEIHNLEYPRSYSKLALCDWNIKVRDGLSVNLYFDTDFEVEEHPDYDDCPFDKLKLSYAGQDDQVFCGSTTPNSGDVIATNARDVSLQFISDLVVEGKGFRVTYNTTRVRCLSNPSEPANGRLETDVRRGYYEFEDTVHFNCIPGYDLVGPDTITCQSDGTWSQPEPICKIKECPDPQFIRDVSYSTNNLERIRFEFDNVASVECNEWYSLDEGSLDWRCNETGQWESHATGDRFLSDDYPQCKAECGLKGKRTLVIESQIAGGKDAQPGEWPWMAFIDRTGDKQLTSSDFCGGSFVSEYYVVTAAHCVDSSIPADLAVFAGAHLRNDESPDEWVQKLSVETIHIHEDVEFRNCNCDLDEWLQTAAYESDIAILKLTEPVVFNDRVRPICLPETLLQQSLAERTLDPNADQDDTRFAKRGVVSGWGLTELGTLSNELKFIRVPAIDRGVCAQAIKNDLTDDYHLSENMFCAGFNSRGAGKKPRDSCQGDSGGPLSFPFNERWYLSGIVSYGILNQCGTKGDFGVYVHVKNYINWIDARLQEK